MLLRQVIFPLWSLLFSKSKGCAWCLRHILEGLWLYMKSSKNSRVDKVSWETCCGSHICVIAIHPWILVMEKQLLSSGQPSLSLYIEENHQCRQIESVRVCQILHFQLGVSNCRIASQALQATMCPTPSSQGFPQQHLLTSPPGTRFKQYPCFGWRGDHAPPCEANGFYSYAVLAYPVRAEGTANL